MPTHSTATTREAGLSAIAKTYFDSLADGNFARVPWADDVILHTPLRPGSPLRGRSAVEAFFATLAGQLGAIRLVETYRGDHNDSFVAEAFIGPLHVLDKFTLREGRIVEQENIFDPRPALEAAPSGGLSADERALLVEMLTNSRERLRAAMQSAHDEDWGRQPADGGWSAAECAEHLVLAEEALLKLVRDQILSGPATPGLALELKGKDSAVVQAMQNRSAKAKTFDFLEPRRKFANRVGALDAFLARRADTIEYVRASRAPMHHHAAPLGALGALDAYQWLLLLAAHTDRHLAQMRESLGA